MWIIPKNLHTSHFVQDMAELTSDLNELSEMCAQSLLVRSKPMQSRTWLRKLKRDSWTQLLFGRILKRSRGKSFTTRLTSSVEGFLVSHSVLQVGEQETMTQDIFGHTSSKESNSWDDLPLFSSKMSKESSAQNSSHKGGLIQSELLFCNMSLESWKGWVTKQRQAYLARAKSVRPIRENEYLFLQYQTNSQNVDVVSSQNQSKDQNWATPTVMDSSSIERSVESLVKRATGARKGRKAPGTLNDQVNPIAVTIYQLLNGTAQEITEQHIQVFEDKNNTDMKHLEQLLEKKTNFPTPMANEHKARLRGNTQASRCLNAVMRGRLNPRWVEQMMGLPVGWVQVSSSEITITEQMSLECWETGLSLTQRQEPSESCGKNWATPRTAMALMGGSSPETDLNWGSRLENQMLGQVQGIPVAEKKALNPRWIEQLMGLPVGWVQVSSSEVTITEQMSLECWGMGSSLTQRQEPSESCGKNWATPTSREIFSDAVYFHTLIRKDGKHRYDQLGVQVRFTEQDVEEAYKKWSTPPSVQRGDTLEVYFRRCIKRIKNGGVKFAPKLQVQVEAEDKNISIDFNGLDYTKDTEELVKELMGKFYQNEE